MSTLDHPAIVRAERDGHPAVSDEQTLAELDQVAVVRTRTTVDLAGPDWFVSLEPREAYRVAAALMHAAYDIEEEHNPCPF